MEFARVLLALCVVLFTGLLWRFLVIFWWRPKKLGEKIRVQGIQGPRMKFMRGNMLELTFMRRSMREKPMDELRHDILDHVLPDYVQWSQKYGKRYVYWWRTEPRIMVHEPELIREILAKKVSQFGKSDLMVRGITSFIGRGLVAVNGMEWSHHRRVVAPAFYMEKLKNMVGTISKCANDMLDRWEAKLQEGPQLEVSADLHELAADVISHTAFGSSYLKGRRVFEILSAIPLENVKLEKYSWIPYIRLLPLPVHFKIKALQDELNTLLLGLINERRDMVKYGRSTSYGSDLLGLVLAESEGDKSSSFNDQAIIDECKTFYLAGHETTATLLAWTVMLLGAYPDWQERARAEVLEVCKDEALDSDAISKLKLMGMILNEALRLYPPVVIFMRGCFEDTKLSDLFVPKGAAVSFPVAAIHRDPEHWGPDVNEFKPERFKDGISQACKHPNAFLPFSLGPRVCVGQSFALIEAKVALASILKRFSFELSPDYRHNPSPVITLRPFSGVPLIMKRL